MYSPRNAILSSAFSQIHPRITPPSVIVSVKSQLQSSEELCWKVVKKRACRFLLCVDISQETALHPSDIVSTLQYLGILKYWKGKHVILRAMVRQQIRANV